MQISRAPFPRSSLFSDALPYKFCSPQYSKRQSLSLYLKEIIVFFHASPLCIAVRKVLPVRRGMMALALPVSLLLGIIALCFLFFRFANSYPI